MAVGMLRRSWLWVLASLFPIDLFAFQGCPGGTAFCSSISFTDCVGYGSGSVNYSGTDPVAGAQSLGACVFCTQGCSVCIAWRVTIVATCNGSEATYSGNLCCFDPDCGCGL